MKSKGTFEITVVLCCSVEYRTKIKQINTCQEGKCVAGRTNTSVEDPSKPGKRSDKIMTLMSVSTQPHNLDFYKTTSVQNFVCTIEDQGDSQN